MYFLGSILHSNHEKLIAAYLEDYINRAEWICDVDIKELVTLCTDLIGNFYLLTPKKNSQIYIVDLILVFSFTVKSIPNQLVVFSKIGVVPDVRKEMHHIKDFKDLESVAGDLNRRTFPLCYGGNRNFCLLALDLHFSSQKICEVEAQILRDVVQIQTQCSINSVPNVTKLIDSKRLN